MKPLLEFGSLLIPTYLLVISLTYTGLTLWMIQRGDQKGFHRETVIDLILAVMIGGFLGGRLLHVVFEAPSHYLSHPLEIFKFWRGGFVFYGGFVGSLLAANWVFNKFSLKKGEWLDLFAPALALGYAFGRLGCFAAGCCFGHSTTLPWGVTFPPGVEAPAHVLLHPTQLYAFVWEILLFASLLLIEKFCNKKPWNFHGGLFTIWLLFHAVGRVLMEYFRADHRGPELLGQSISSWISYILILLCGFIFYKNIKGEKNAS